MVNPRNILLGFLIGAALGLGLHAAWPEAPPTLNALLNYLVEPLGRLFLRLLLMIVLPLVVSSLMLGVAEMGDARRVGRVAIQTLAFTLLATTLSVLTGLLFVSVFKPGEGFPPQVRDSFLEKGNMPGSLSGNTQGFTQALLALVPDNPIKAAASGDFLGVMFFSLLFGLGLVCVDGEKSKPLLHWLDSVFEASMAFIHLVMRIAPIGVGALALHLTARFGYELLTHLMGYAAVVLLAMAFHLLCNYSLLIWIFGEMSPREFFSKSQEAMLTAFATSSSTATLPVTIRVSEKRLKIPRDIARFILTIGASANQNGTALYEGVTVLFLAQCFGVYLSIGQQALVLFMAILGGVGTAGVPGASLPMLMLILSSVGVPPQGVLLILGIDRFLDMCRTVLNVTGDMLTSVLVAGSQKK